MGNNADKYGMKRDSGLQIIMDISDQPGEKKVKITKQCFFHSKVHRKTSLPFKKVGILFISGNFVLETSYTHSKIFKTCETLPGTWHPALGFSTH